MAYYDMSTLLKAHNIEPHKDIALAMLKKKTGLFTFILRINAGRIVDFVEMEYFQYKQEKK